MEGLRTRNAGTVDFGKPIYGHRAPSPLWVFCAFVQVGGIAESPWVFGDASRLHDLKRLSLFRRDEVPARNTNRQSGFAFTHQKVLGGSKGRFFKNAPWQGEGQRPTKRGEPAHRGTPFQAGRSPCTKYRQIVRLRLHAPKKVFEGSKGRFFKNAPWQGVGQRPAKRGRASKRGTPFQAGQGPFTKRPQTVRLCLYAPKKFLRVPRGVFQKRALGRVREESHKRRYKHFQRGQPSKPGILRNPYKSLTEPWEKEEKDFAIL